MTETQKAGFPLSLGMTECRFDGNDGMQVSAWMDSSFPRRRESSPFGFGFFDKCRNIKFLDSTFVGMTADRILLFPINDPNLKSVIPPAGGNLDIQY